MRIRHGLCLAAVSSSCLAVAAGARADEQDMGGGGGGSLVGVGSNQSAAPAAAPAAAPVRVVYARTADRLPVAYVDRPLTNPAGVLSPSLGFDIWHAEVLPRGLFGVGNQFYGSMQLGAGYSITDDLAVRGTAFVLQFNDPAQLAEAGLGFTYRFIRGQFEMGVAVDWVYQTPSNINAFVGVGAPGQDIIPALPMRFHFGHVVRMDLTPSLPLSTAGIYIPYFGGVGGGKTTMGLDVPLTFNFQLLDQLHIDVGTGLNMTFNPDSAIPGTDFGDFFSIPFGFDLGMSVPGTKGPVLDMTPFFVWPSLLVPGVQNGLNGVQSGVWVTGIDFRAYFYL